MIDLEKIDKKYIYCKVFKLFFILLLLLLSLYYIILYKVENDFI